MTDYEIATLASSVAIGLGQIGIVWYGIRSMNRASAERAQDRAQAARVADQRDADARRRDADARRRDADSRRRHDEAMTALRELIARTAPAAERSPP